MRLQEIIKGMVGLIDLSVSRERPWFPCPASTSSPRHFTPLFQWSWVELPARLLSHRRCCANDIMQPLVGQYWQHQPFALSGSSMFSEPRL